MIEPKYFVQCHVLGKCDSLPKQFKEKNREDIEQAPGFQEILGFLVFLTAGSVTLLASIFTLF